MSLLTLPVLPYRVETVADWTLWALGEAARLCEYAAEKIGG